MPTQLEIRERDFIDGLALHLSSLKSRRASLLTHVGGDMDALSSCLVLSSILRERLGIEVAGICIPDHVNEASSKAAQLLGLQLSSGLIESEHYIAVDVGSLEQLGSFKGPVRGRLSVIDHHEVSPSFKEWGEVFSSTSYQSVCEIVLELAARLGYELTSKEATALLAGMYYDTVRLTIADSITLVKIGWLGERGASAPKLLPLLDAPLDESERIARLKAARRLEIYKCDDLIIAATHVGAHRPAAARSLISLGAHVAIVGDEKGGEVDVSLRASSEVSERFGINLVRDVVNPLINKLGGRGGGHAAAARLTARGELKEILSRCVSQIAYLVGTVPKRVGE